MLDVAAHMLLLQRQAQIKNDRPDDQSFLPLSLAIACLLRQLPSGLAPPAGILSFHQIDRLPIDVLEQKLARLVYGDQHSDYNSTSPPPQDGSAALDRVWHFLRSIVVYARTTRALLAICHAHLTNQCPTVETTQALVDYVVDAFTLAEDGPEKPASDASDASDHQGTHGVSGEMVGELPGTNDEEVMVMANPSAGDAQSGGDHGRERHPRARRTHSRKSIGQSIPKQDAPPAVAVDPSGIMKRAVARDVGDGSTVIQILAKFPDDARIQAHGVRALKSVIRKFPSKPRTSNQPPRPAQHDDSDDDERDADALRSGTDHHQKGKATAVDDQDERRLDIVRLVVSSMKRHPENLTLQRDALFCLLEYTSQADDHVAAITSLGGVVSIMEAMAHLPDDEDAQIAALSILGHPTVAEESVVRVNPESRRLVMSAMRRFPLSERLQGLACLALGNLSLRHDESMKEVVARGGLELVVAAMNRFSEVTLIQAAGSWLLSTVSGKDDDMVSACLEAGGLPACEKARVRFVSDQRVQQHTVFAIQNMVRDVPERGHEGDEKSFAPAAAECCLQ